MGRVSEPEITPGRSQHELLVRGIRHEVGDLLQSLYATVALLKQRLPEEWELEGRLLGDLRKRGETCRHILDDAHDFVMPMSALRLEEVDLAELTAELLHEMNCPNIAIRTEARPPGRIFGDRQRLLQSGRKLLKYVCQAARSQVLVATGPAAEPGKCVWSFTDDGRPLTQAECDKLFTPFATPRADHPGLGLPLAGKIISLHGGQLTYEIPAQAGLRLVAVLPYKPVVSAPNSIST